MDLFARLPHNKDLHPQFLKTRDDPSSAPARAMLSEIARTMADPDGNFVEQFQTHGFDARTFELYLQALFREGNFEIDRSYERPDFLISKGGVTVAVEAVTANPTPSREYQPYDQYPGDLPRSAEDIMRYLKHEVAIRFGSPLYSKLQKRYWGLPHVSGRPFVIALQSFHGGGLGLSSTSLSQYLFGIDHHHYFADGELVVEGRQVDKHTGSKTIPSRFFGLPEADNVSGILFSNAGTVPKFGRMGQQGRYRSNSVRMAQVGQCWDPDPQATMPEVFAYEVGKPDIPPEPWRDGSVFIRNPWAKHPVPEEWLNVSAEENLVEGNRVAPTMFDPFHVYASQTYLLSGDLPDDRFDEVVDELVARLEMGQVLGEQLRS